MAKSRRLLEKAHGNGILRSDSGGEQPVAYTLEVRQDLVDGLPGTKEIEGFVTFSSAVDVEQLEGGVLELKDGRTTEVAWLLGESPAGEMSRVRFRGGPLGRQRR